jgi:hypothetical protein
LFGVTLRGSIKPTVFQKLAAQDFSSSRTTNAA